MKKLPLDQILEGDCTKILPNLPEQSVDMIFADPPYNLQLNKTLYRPDHSKVEAVSDQWDQFDNFKAYDQFTESWLAEARRVLKEDGTLWVIGTYHNIFRIGRILQDLGFWVLNDVIWHKNNPMPNFRGTRLTNSHETLIWCSKHKHSRYQFNYKSMKSYNEGKQMPSDWRLPICRGKERLMLNGEKVHATQKPEALLDRVILTSTKKDDVILDPFFGTGTTGASAKKLGRHYIGIEQSDHYSKYAAQRLEQVKSLTEESLQATPETTKQKRVPFVHLIEAGYLKVGDQLQDKSGKYTTTIQCDSSLIVKNKEGEILQGSIHQTGAFLQNSATCNGWTYWYYHGKGKWHPINDLRQSYIEDAKNQAAA